MKNKSDDMICCGFDVISVCSLIDYGQQTMKMLTDVALLYKYNTLEIINNNEVQ